MKSVGLRLLNSLLLVPQLNVLFGVYYYKFLLLFGDVSCVVRNAFT